MKFKELLKPLAAAVVLTSSVAAVNAQTAGSSTDTGRVEEVVVTALGIKNSSAHWVMQFKPLRVRNL